MVRLPQWQFVQDQNHQWHWTCTTDRARIVSATAFSDRADCLIDAIRSVGAARPNRTPTVVSTSSRVPPLHLSVRYSIACAKRMH
ncbi:MAG: hypothetical protein JWO68_4052 [Actinomycetia bacterium]|nr:hypothetical protein [Actinomycetes bacterium]